MSNEPSIPLSIVGERESLSGRLTLPVRVHVGGVEAVLVAAEAYDALFQASQRSVGTRSRIERDPEVQRFVDERSATRELAVLRAEITQAFGSDRTPSQSGLHRYVMARRKAAEAVTKPPRGHRGPRSPR